MLIPYYTILFTGLHLLLLLALSFPVAYRRKQTRELLGTSDPILQRRSSAFSNFAEYTPFFLIGLLLVEWLQYSTTALVLGILFFAGRIIHAISLRWAEPVKGTIALRGIAMLTTYACLLTIAGTLIVTFFLLPR